ncbi:hypothetical protein [Paenibacillus sp. MBLB4367]|uniref:hypothetical protein n=1 Tax=Paenibacillus sp. MBLB4367 TaxID=3384767 RepID=UPI00390831C6
MTSLHAQANDDWNSLTFFYKYACHLKASCFPVLTANRRTYRTTEREILLFGDSHSWGQGSPDFDGLHFYSPHMAFSYNKGYYARLSKHVQQKLDFPASAVLPGSTEIPLQGRFCEAACDFYPPYEAAGFYAPEANNDKAKEHLGYLAEDGKFGKKVFVLSPFTESAMHDAEGHLTLKSPVRKLFVGIVAGPHGSKLEIALAASPYSVIPPGFPKVYRVAAGRLAEVDKHEAEIGVSGSVILDTYRSTGPADCVYCVDYGMKQTGILSLRYAGEHPSASGCELGRLTLDAPAVLIRGIVFDGNRIRNFAMGGHTVGQWIGDGTASFHDVSYPHTDELLSYVPFTPTLAIIQAPVVNEYLNQTEISDFQRNLSSLIGKLNAHLNDGRERKTDFLIFTTPGDQRNVFQGEPSKPIPYSAYFEAVNQFCLTHQYGFIDFQRYFADAVKAGMLDHDLLYDDAIHPSPFVNEWIAKGLISALDMLW